MADKQNKTAAKAGATKKPIRVLRRRKVLHMGIDLSRAPWIRTLVRALPANVENHASHADDATASLLQLHRPKFPEIRPGAGPGLMNRMARVMKGYELTLSYGDRVFPATMAHTLFGQALKLPPHVHVHDGVDVVPPGFWPRFRHKLGLARSTMVLVPTMAAAASVRADWQVPAAALRILPPPFPGKPKPVKPDTIPRLVKRAGERWIAIRADHALALEAEVINLLLAVDPEWHLVVFGEEAKTEPLRKAADAAGLIARFHATSRLAGPASVAPLFDLAVIDARDGLVPADLPSLMAAGVAVIACGPAGLADLMPADNASQRVDPAARGRIVDEAIALCRSDRALDQAGAANAAFAAARADPAPWLAALADAMGLSSLEER
ncbi:hypothetical protein [Croceicoccus sp. BE223]|uniref:hypothetical protein n=1 Tax=Croceicoccus sp. BE223 TaxID=2817716 RepID=UPI002863FEA2|nr:hypothetical protein [Croceicoccus sp. BE223]MDR7102462.1 hypothetical protein [Croceicoccus sp. BE223]